MITDIECKNAKCPEGKKYIRISDTPGLYLEVSKTGRKRWFAKLYFGGKETRMALGGYPAVTGPNARKARDAARVLKDSGTNPIQDRKLKKLKATQTGGDSFKAIALEWYEKKAPLWSDHHAKRVKAQLERDLFPWIGVRPIKSIQAIELLHALQRIEKRGAVETAHRTLTVAKQIWDYWLPTADVQQRNITEGLKARLTPYIGKNFAAVIDPKRMGELMRAIHAYKGGVIARTALQLTPYLYQRPGNLRMMEWSELNLDAALWTIPSEKMKRIKVEKLNGQPHVVPLPTQAVKLLRDMHPLTGHGRYVFPGERDHDRTISDNTVRSALYALGFGEEQKPHGFRASARTMLVDELNLDWRVIEANLAHKVKDANGTSYNRTKYLAQRFHMIQTWADYLDKLRDGADVIPLRA